MDEIFSPTFAKTHPDYALEAEEALDLHVQELINDAVQAGWDTRVIIKALETVAKAKSVAYEEDPDPEDDDSKTVDPSTPQFGAFVVE
ncbi:hypothetical protein [Rhizobium sp. Leaf383]|uniref:hypothetical protein n=1 Tax=Rhizobium sp. Leaf383 TaxID=1736357 RepID=UPI000714E1F4|nr:hypothetical protein [Rhizobium sp. Leaf383]KQS84837.1 hypothetical protein ASG58_20305 [Rhizobium sp. Leaf383]